jgi:O2-independent ubiquinone biosynthesis protein UbiV
MKLTLGPNLFNWPTSKWQDFYARIADEAPIDRVCVGEAVCSKRTPFRNDVIADVIERLQRGGKEVVLTTLALPTSKREVNEIVETANDRFLIEANDITTVALLQGRPFVVGPFVNVYNEETLAEFATLGATSVCLPPELPLEAIGKIAARRCSVDIELFAFGRTPLALSARCYHARIHNLPKDACKFVCEQDLDGLTVDTIDDDHFLTVNGIQTMSHTVTALSSEVRELDGAGVGRLRLSPQTCDMVEVANAYRDLLDQRIGASELLVRLEGLQLPAPVANGYLHGRKGVEFIT